MFKIIGAGSGTFFLDPDLELLKSGSWIRIRNKSFRIPNTGKKNKQIKNVRIISLKSAQMILKSLYIKNCNGHWLKKNKFLALQIYNQKRKKYIAQTICQKRFSTAAQGNLYFLLWEILKNSKPSFQFENHAKDRENVWYMLAQTHTYMIHVSSDTYVYDTC